ncbi:hypothetical protein DFS34DRAFT_621848 [Phlyctochytrium arcticum]|nr:hypothetical protein DFS34DRAFT_621848 [Phlyctochytrium arcticum]
MAETHPQDDSGLAAMPHLRISTTPSFMSSGLNTPTLRSGMLTPDPLLSALRSPSESFFSSAAQTPGSMTPRSRERYDIKRAQLVRDLEMHDQKMESRSLDQRLRRELFLDKARREDERFEMIRRRRAARDQERKINVEKDFREREKEVINVRRQSSRSMLSDDGPSPRPSISTTGRGSSLASLPSLGSSTDVGKPPRSGPVTNDLESFQEERRLKRLQRQKAEEDRRKMHSVLRDKVAETIDNVFADEEDDPKASAPHSGPMARKSSLTERTRNPMDRHSSYTENTTNYLEESVADPSDTRSPAITRRYTTYSSGNDRAESRSSLARQISGRAMEGSTKPERSSAPKTLDRQISRIDRNWEREREQRASVRSQMTVSVDTAEIKSSPQEPPERDHAPSDSLAHTSGNTFALEKSRRPETADKSRAQQGSDLRTEQFSATVDKSTAGISEESLLPGVVSEEIAQQKPVPEEFVNDSTSIKHTLKQSDYEDPQDDPCAGRDVVSSADPLPATPDLSFAEAPAVLYDVTSPKSTQRKSVSRDVVSRTDPLPATLDLSTAEAPAVLSDVASPKGTQRNSVSNESGKNATPIMSTHDRLAMAVFQGALNPLGLEQPLPQIHASDQIPPTTGTEGSETRPDPINEVDDSPGLSEIRPGQVDSDPNDVVSISPWDDQSEDSFRQTSVEVPTSLSLSVSSETMLSEPELTDATLPVLQPFDDESEQPSTVREGSISGSDSQDMVPNLESSDDAKDEGSSPCRTDGDGDEQPSGPRLSKNQRMSRSFDSLSQTSDGQSEGHERFAPVRDRLRVWEKGSQQNLTQTPSRERPPMIDIFSTPTQSEDKSLQGASPLSKSANDLRAALVDKRLPAGVLRRPSSPRGSFSNSPVAVRKGISSPSNSVMQSPSTPTKSPNQKYTRNSPDKTSPSQQHVPLPKQPIANREPINRPGTPTKPAGQPHTPSATSSPSSSKPLEMAAKPENEGDQTQGDDSGSGAVGVKAMIKKFASANKPTTPSTTAPPQKLNLAAIGQGTLFGQPTSASREQLSETSPDATASVHSARSPSRSSRETSLQAPSSAELPKTGETKVVGNERQDIGANKRRLELSSSLTELRNDGSGLLLNTKESASSGGSRETLNKTLPNLSPREVITIAQRISLGRHVRPKSYGMVAGDAAEPPMSFDSSLTFSPNGGKDWFRDEFAYYGELAENNLLDDFPNTECSTLEESSDEMPSADANSSEDEGLISCLPDAREPLLQKKPRVKGPNRRAPTLEHLRQNATDSTEREAAEIPLSMNAFASRNAVASPTSISTSDTAFPVAAGSSGKRSNGGLLRLSVPPPHTREEPVSPNLDDQALTPNSRATFLREKLQALTATAATITAPRRPSTPISPLRSPPNLPLPQVPTTMSRKDRSRLSIPVNGRRSNILCQPELYLIKGKRKLYTTRITIDIENLNHGDVYILVVPIIGEDGSVSAASLLAWFGREAGHVKRAKAKEVVYRMKDRDWGGKAEVEFLDDSQNSRNSRIFWRLLTRSARSTPPPQIRSAAEGVDDLDHEKNVEKYMQLYGIQEDESTSIVATPLAKPLVVQSLASHPCTVLDCYNEVYIWASRNSTDEQKALAKTFVREFCEKSERTSLSVYFEREGLESVSFRERFVDWRDDSGGKIKSPTNITPKERSWGVYDMGASVGKVEKIAVENMFKSPPPPAGWGRSNEEDVDYGGPPPIELDRGCLERKVWLVDTAELDQRRELAPSEHGVFYARDAYLIFYRHLTGRDGNEKEAAIVYFWIGQDCKATDQAAAAYSAAELEKKHRGRQIRVVQGKEPAHFLSIFQTPVLIRRGMREEFVPGDRAIYQVAGWSKDCVRVVETIWNTSSLSTGNSFVLNLKDRVFVWHGLGSFSFERKMAESVAERITDFSRPIVIFDEGQEPKGFWQKLGGIEKKSHNHQVDYASSPGLAKKRAFEGRFRYRLWRISYIVHGNPTAEEIDPFTQYDLDTSGVYILDAFFKIYVWKGADAKNKYKEIKLALETCIDYSIYAAKVQGDRQLDRQKLYFVSSGTEPQGFKACFTAFDDGSEDIAGTTGFLNKLKPKSSRRKKEAQQEFVIDVLEKFDRATYTFDELRKREDLPLGVDPLHVEAYLSPADFQKHFKIDRETFLAYPAWTQSELKRKAGLF